MPVFHYQSIDLKGRRVKATIQATTLSEAKESLRHQGLLIVKIAKCEKRFQLSGSKDLKGDVLVSFTRELASLLKASLPLYESLLSIEEHYRGEKYHGVLVTLSEKIKGGSSLSEAMREFPKSFDSLYVAMVAAGESIGSLDLALDNLAELLAKQRKLKKQLITALVYPSLIFAFSCLVILVLLTFVIPSIEAIFADHTVNRFTGAVIAASHFVTGGWRLYLPFLLMIGFGIGILLKRPRLKAKIFHAFLQLPFIRTLMTAIALSRFTRTLGSLLQGGVSMIPALQFSRKVMGHPILEEVIEKAEARIIEGSLLSKELKRSRFIPSLVSRFLAIGEEGGNLHQMLIRLATLYEEEVEKLLTRTLALIQPSILLLMGGFVGVIMMAVLLPLTDVNAFIGGG